MNSLILTFYLKAPKVEKNAIIQFLSSSLRHKNENKKAVKTMQRINKS